MVREGSPPPPAKLLAQGEDVKLAGGDLQTGEPRVFAVPLSSADRAEFFIERGAGNDINVAFASCRKCYRSGHYRQGNEIYCGRCNEPMRRLSHGQTPASAIDCTQIPIPFERIGDNVVIRANAVRDAFWQCFQGFAGEFGGGGFKADSSKRSYAVAYKTESVSRNAHNPSARR